MQDKEPVMFCCEECRSMLNEKCFVDPRTGEIYSVCAVCRWNRKNPVLPGKTKRLQSVYRPSAPNLFASIIPSCAWKVMNQREASSVRSWYRAKLVYHYSYKRMRLSTKDLSWQELFHSWGLIWSLLYSCLCFCLAVACLITWVFMVTCSLFCLLI